MEEESAKLVQGFALAVRAQNEAIMRGDARTGNRHARRYIDCVHRLFAMGDSGKDALARLFEHPRPDVRVAAAAFLLRHATSPATAILEEAAQGAGLTALDASECLKRWEEGNWHLDEL